MNFTSSRGGRQADYTLGNLGNLGNYNLGKLENQGKKYGKIGNFHAPMDTWVKIGKLAKLAWLRKIGNPPTMMLDNLDNLHKLGKPAGSKLGKLCVTG